MSIARREWATIAIVALGFRVFSALLALLANIVFPDAQREQFTVFGSTSPFWDAFARYDSGWYQQIARNGYEYTPGGRSTIAFFPVYPLLMRHVGRLFGPRPSDLYLGGLVISWLAFVAAMVGLYALARLDLTRQRAARAAVLAAVFPFAFFFGAVYTEALFLAAVVWSFYLFRTDRFIAGGLAGAVATATRVNGILMWPALAWLAWRSVSRVAPAQMVRHRVNAVAGLLLVGAGVGGYCLYIYRLTGDPFEWVATIERWGYYPGGVPWLALGRLVQELVTRPYAFLAGGGTAPYDALNGVAGLAAVAAVPLVWAKLGAAYGLFMAVNLWLPLSSGSYEGIGRYCAVLFPLFIWLATLPRTAFVALIVIFSTLYMLCLALFTNIHPIF
jgi:hypothetical protein